MLSRDRQLKAIAAVVTILVLALVAVYFQSLPSPYGTFLAVVVALVSYSAVDRVLDLAFGSERSSPSGIDPMPRLRYHDEVKRRLEDSLNEPQTKEDFFNFPNARAFVLSLPLIGQKNAELKKLEGKRAVLQDSLYIGDDFKAQASRPRVEVFVEHAVDEMTLPEEAKQWGLVSPEREPTPTFTSQVADSRLAAMRGGYASILIHLYSFEHWLDLCKGWMTVPTREDFQKENPIQDSLFGREFSAKEYMKRSADRDADYDRRVDANKIFREYRLGADKMKGSIQSAFEKTFPGQLAEVVKTSESYINEVEELDKSMGMFGAFSFGSAMTRSLQESGLVLQEVERLRRVFSKDESVMLLLNNLREEHKFMLERVHLIASSKHKGLPW